MSKHYLHSLLATALLSVSIGLSVNGQIPASASSADFEDFANTLLSAPSKQERQALLSQKKDLMTPELRRALIRQGNLHLMAGRYATAFEVYDLAQTIA